MLARLSAFVIWAFVAATAVFWGLRLWVQAPGAPVYAVAVGDATAGRADLTRLLGSAPVAQAVIAPLPEAASRFRLLGIVAPKYPAANVPTRGVALITIDGQMPKAYAVGASLEGDMVLQSVSLRTVSIGPERGPSAVTLELPPLVPPATGVLGGGRGIGSSGTGSSGIGSPGAGSSTTSGPGTGAPGFVPPTSSPSFLPPGQPVPPPPTPPREPIDQAIQRPGSLTPAQ